MNTINLTAAFHHMADSPDYIGHVLYKLRQQAGIGPEQQALALGISVNALARLSLCWWPPTDRRAEDLATIAGEVGMEPGRLAELLGIRDTPREKGER